MDSEKSFEAAANNEEMAAVSVKARIPQFWRQKPRLWFAQYESIIANQKMGDEAKYHLVVAQLELADIEQVGDILLSPPENNKYEALKQRLLSVYEESESRQLQKLLGEMELGSQKPSQLLRKMRDLALDRVPDNTLKIMWTGHLPPSVRAVLAISTETKLDVLATMADKMTEQTHEISSICSCATTSKPTTNEDLISKIDALSREIASLKMNQVRNRGPFRNNNFNNRNRSRSRSANRVRKDPLCYFHRKFGKNAYRCQQPCDFKKNNNINNKSEEALN